MTRMTKTAERPGSSRRHLCVLAIAGVVIGLAACTYRGDIDNPATLKATWFSYLNGDDIRQRCVEGAPDAFRMVYNADYNEQLRSYEVVEQAAGGARLTARVQGSSGLQVSRLDLRDPLAWARWTTSETALDAEDLARLTAALERSGAFRPAPAGLNLYSEETYWVSSLCRDGAFSFNAWLFPSERFAEIAFAEVLFAHDGTEVAVRPPKDAPPGARARATVPQRRDASDKTGSFFTLRVGENGLAGSLAL
ncbi:hypothetical protein [Pelagibius sp.]|uniref:hypothetical protein n=1 Tax=Pelagibius sp. TaxID=1931238 RepID=UPI002603FCB0|nr:hypothetical protein [Pelagibius sp.]